MRFEIQYFIRMMISLFELTNIATIKLMFVSTNDFQMHHLTEDLAKFLQVLV
jgi:hypothetical protein